MLLVSSAVILDSRRGRCASGKVVLGAVVEDVRFVAGMDPVVELGSDVDGMPLIGMDRSRSGRDGTANFGVTFTCLSCGIEMKVNGSIGYGVSDGRIPAVS